jgi:hypothetical protein
MVTGYSRLSAPQARAVFAILLFGTLFFAAVTVSPIWKTNFHRPKRGAGDVALFRAIIDRVHEGEGFYQASAAELTSRGYPTRSVFNWRMPLPMCLIARLPNVEWAKYILGAMSVVLMILAFEALARDTNYMKNSGRMPDNPGSSNLERHSTVSFSHPMFRSFRGARQRERGYISDGILKRNLPASLGVRLFCVILLGGPLLFTMLNDLFVMPVLWAGVLIGLSVCAYGINTPKIGFVLGLAALFIRELALPYCLLCAAMALRAAAGSSGSAGSTVGQANRGTHKFTFNRELIAWVLGFAAWLLYFGWHWWNASGLIGPDAVAHKHGWIRFAGAGFVLATVQMNAYLLLLPPWATALYFAAALLGLGGWHTPFGTRVGLTICLYVLFFSVVGQDINQYWGSLTAPLLCIAAAQSPAALRDLLRAAVCSSAKSASLV